MEEGGNLLILIDLGLIAYRGGGGAREKLAVLDASRVLGRVLGKEEGSAGRVRHRC